MGCAWPVLTISLAMSVNPELSYTGRVLSSQIRNFPTPATREVLRAHSGAQRALSCPRASPSANRPASQRLRIQRLSNSASQRCSMMALHTQSIAQRLRGGRSQPSKCRKTYLLDHTRGPKSTSQRSCRTRCRRGHGPPPRGDRCSPVPL